VQQQQQEQEQQVMSDYYGPPGGDDVSSSTDPQQQQQQPSYHPRGGGSRSSGSAAAPPPGTLDQGKIFVGGLSWQTTEESLRFYFERYGEVANVEVMKDRMTGEPRGFGFVVFKEGSTVDLVMEDPTHEINHKVVDVKRAQARGVAPPSIHEKRGGESDAGDGGSQQGDPRGNTPRGAAAGGGGGGGFQKSFPTSHGNDQLTPEQLHNKVFVGGIPPHIDKDGLKEIFEEFGPVVDAIVMMDQNTNRSRCFGFVTFENGSNGAQKAIAVQPLNIQGRNVEVKLATPKAEQQQRRGPPAAGPKHVGLRAGMSSSSSGEFAGLAVAYGRSGWKAGYGTFAFGQAGWGVVGWEDQFHKVPDRAGFSFDMLEEPPVVHDDMVPPSKKVKY
jgi:RNA recognition motif-containing protein